MATYTITNDNAGNFAVNADDREIGRVPATCTINGSTDSDSVVAQCADLIDGEIVAVDHDGPYIHVTTN